MAKLIDPITRYEDTLAILAAGPGAVINVDRSHDYCWCPEEDITTYEMAVCMPVLIASSKHGSNILEFSVPSLPECAQRHFRRASQKG